MYTSTVWSNDQGMINWEGKYVTKNAGDVAYCTY
jgi:hypothetical protein